MRKTLARLLHQFACWIAPEKARLTLHLDMGPEHALKAIWDDLRAAGIETDPYLDFSVSWVAGLSREKADSMLADYRKHLH